MAKLEKILEAMDSFRIDSDVALLENDGIDDLTRAQTKKALHESFGFIKTQLTKGGILEDTQAMLANAWTQAIMEDISMEDIRNSIPTGEDVDKFAKNVYNTGKAFVNENIPNSIPTGEDVDKFAKKVYNTGKAFANENIPKFTNSEHAAAIADLNSQHANALAAINAQHANEVGGLKAQHTNEVGGLKADIGSYQNSQAGLISTLGGKGATLGVQADSMYADGVNKANAIPGQAQAAYGQAKDAVNAIPGQAQAAYGQAKAGLGARLNPDGEPISDNQMAAIGAGSAAMGAGIGYGAYKLGQKVRRA